MSQCQVSSTIIFEWCSCSWEVLWIFLRVVVLHWDAFRLKVLFSWWKSLYGSKKKYLILNNIVTGFPCLTLQKEIIQLTDQGGPKLDLGRGNSFSILLNFEHYLSYSMRVVRLFRLTASKAPAGQLLKLRVFKSEKSVRFVRFCFE